MGIPVKDPESRGCRFVVRVLALGCLLLSPLSALPADSPSTSNANSNERVWPTDWDLGNNKTITKEYRFDLDPKAEYQGKKAYLLQSQVEHPKNIGTISTRRPADEYEGKQVRFSAFVKSQDISGKAELWIRADASHFKKISAKSTEGSPIHGTTDWKKYDMTFQVPKRATVLLYGVVLNGAGKLWIAEPSLEVIQKD